MLDEPVERVGYEFDGGRDAVRWHHPDPVDDHVGDAHDGIPDGVPCGFERGDSPVVLQFCPEVLEPFDGSIDGGLDDGGGGGQAVAYGVHGSGDHWFDRVEHGHAGFDGRCFEVAKSALDGAGAGRGLLGRVGHAELHDRLVEFAGRDLAFGHRVAEVAGIGSVLPHRLLEFAGCSRDRVGELVPVLGGEFAGAGGLRHDHGD